MESFSPPEITQAESYLVVDGYLNTGNYTSTILLSRTQNLTEYASNRVIETNAQVTVEGEKGSILSFLETSDGVYTLSPQNVDQTDNFRIRIKTKDGKVYLSDYTPVKNTPEIDSITYQVIGDREGARINVNTHDALNQTHFYRWEFDETWEYHAAYQSLYEVINKGTSSASIEPRATDVYTCWQSNKPVNILIGSTVKLSQDLVRDKQITYVPASSGKLAVRYSILVKQYALSQEAYEYWTELAKTTEGTGSIFDALPSQVTGNIHCTTDSKEPVFGFFSVGAPKEKRYFLPVQLVGYSSCGALDSLYTEEMTLVSDSLIIEQVAPADENSPVMYRVINEGCIDCRVYGGTTQKPSFW